MLRRMPPSSRPDIQRFPGLLFTAIVVLGCLLAMPGTGRHAQADTPPVALVTSNADDNSPGTLRAVITTATPGSIIRFALPPASSVILQQGEIVIDKPLDIQGPGVGELTILGAGSRLLTVAATAGQVRVSDLTLMRGIAVEGGAIYNAGDLTLLRVDLHSNTARGQVGRGGAILNAGRLRINASLLRYNGALAFAPVAQYAYAGGGAIWNGQDLEIVNSTIVYNSVACEQGMCRDRSGGAILSTGYLTITASTITDNGSDGTGPGIYQMGGSLLLGNSVLAGCVVLPHASGGHNLDTDGSCGLDAAGDISNADPLLGPLQDNQGPTQTRALLPGSPARDAGDAATCRATDQRGALRPADGNGDGTPACDIGAFEANASFPVLELTVNTTADSSDGVCDVSDCTLREAIMAANAVAPNATIRFAIPGAGPHTIRPLAALPPPAGHVTIDGFTQPGATPNTNPFGRPSNARLLIELDGSLAGSGLTLRHGGVVRGLVLNRFGDYAIGGGGDKWTTIEGCYIGTDVTGTQALGNNVGVFHDFVKIGGPDPADRTLISGNNGYGITASNASVKVEGTYIGTDAAGVKAIPNRIAIDIGSGGLEMNNSVMSGNGGGAFAYNSAMLIVHNSLIGWDATGTQPLGNQGAAFGMSESSGEFINNRIAFNGVGINGPDRAPFLVMGGAITDNRGPGIFVNRGGATIADVLIARNQDSGVVLDLGAYDVRILHSTITDNRGATGAGIRFCSAAGCRGDLTLIGSTVSNNQATAGGGGISAWSNLTLINSTVSGNQAAGGGGIDSRSQITVVNSTVSGNQATSGAGIRLGNNANGTGYLTLIGSTVSGNQATTSGGGIDSLSQLTLVNSTVTGNTAAGQPSGITARAALTLTAVTLTDPLSGDGPITAQGSILAGCTPGTAVTSQGHNLDSTTTCALSGPGDLTGLDPLLGPLQGNGGPTWTRVPLACSPAIDAGLAIEGVTADQRGLPRPFDGNGDGHALPDIGAVEVQQRQLQRGAITVIKDAVPDSVRNFRFFGPFGTFRLDDPGFDDGDGVSNAITYTDVIPGRHGFSDDLPFRWWLTNVTCEPANACEPDLVHQNLQVTVRACQHVTATFTNSEEGTLFAHSYWDKNGNRNREPNEPMLSGWWTELYDLSGSAPRLAASNFTNANGKWNVRSLVPGRDYAVCQKPQATWQNTQPGRLYPEYRNWPCYTFRVQPAQGVEAWFGYTAAQVRATELNEQTALDGLHYLDAVIDGENDAMYTEQEYVDSDLAAPEPYEPDDTGSAFGLYLPAVAK